VSEDELPPESEVFRFLRRADYHFDPGPAVARPVPGDFRPTSDDRELAERLGSTTVPISFWDSSLTTLEQAVAVRTELAGSPPHETRAVFVRLGDLQEVALRHGFEVRAFRHLLDGVVLPGATGHCRVHGMVKPRGVVKVEHRSFLVDAASLFSPME